MRLLSVSETAARCQKGTGPYRTIPALDRDRRMPGWSMDGSMPIADIGRIPDSFPDDRSRSDKAARTAPTGRDSIAQGASALGRIADEIVLAPTGRDSLVVRWFCRLRNHALSGLRQFWDRFPGLAPWAIESRPIRGCQLGAGNKTGIQFVRLNLVCFSTSGCA
jgi:hypothetical protein